MTYIHYYICKAFQLSSLLQESGYIRDGSGEIIAKSAVQIVQPDIITPGGIWELRKIAAMAEARDWYCTICHTGQFHLLHAFTRPLHLQIM